MIRQIVQTNTILIRHLYMKLVQRVGSLNLKHVASVEYTDDFNSEFKDE